MTDRQRDIGIKDKTGFKRKTEYEDGEGFRGFLMSVESKCCVSEAYQMKAPPIKLH